MSIVARVQIFLVARVNANQILKLVINPGPDMCEKGLFSKLNTPTYHTNLLSNMQTFILSNIQTFISPNPHLYKRL